ncbi:MAG: hypothetical protein J5855_09190 [Mailhella sp.]|nr:hypothetical protein [Mailhella sp.]
MIGPSRLPSYPQPGFLRVLWTYPGLEDDLTGNVDPERQLLVRSLIKDLAHPVGTHYFWPFRLSGRDPEPAMFWAGVSLAAPRIALIMGEEAWEALVPGKKLPVFGIDMRKRLHVIRLFGTAEMPPGSNNYKAALAFLRVYLRFAVNNGKLRIEP